MFPLGAKLITLKVAYSQSGQCHYSVELTEEIVQLETKEIEWTFCLCCGAWVVMKLFIYCYYNNKEETGQLFHRASYLYSSYVEVLQDSSAWFCQHYLSHWAEGSEGSVLICSHISEVFPSAVKTFHPLYCFTVTWHINQDVYPDMFLAFCNISLNLMHYGPPHLSTAIFLLCVFYASVAQIHSFIHFLLYWYVGNNSFRGTLFSAVPTLTLWPWWWGE